MLSPNILLIFLFVCKFTILFLNQSWKSAEQDFLGTDLHEIGLLSTSGGVLLILFDVRSGGGFDYNYIFCCQYFVIFRCIVLNNGTSFLILLDEIS